MLLFFLLANDVRIPLNAIEVLIAENPFENIFYNAACNTIWSGWIELSYKMWKGAKQKSEKENFRRRNTGFLEKMSVESSRREGNYNITMTYSLSYFH